MFLPIIKIIQMIITLPKNVQSHENFKHISDGSHSYVHRLNQCFDITPFISYVMFQKPISVKRLIFYEGKMHPHIHIS